MAKGVFAFHCHNYAKQCVASSLDEATKRLGCGDCSVLAEEGCYPSKVGSFIVLEGGQGSSNLRLLQAFILQKLRKLQVKTNDNKYPFRYKAFRKQLADLLVLLERFMDLDQQFAELVNKRRKIQIGNGRE